MYDINGVFRFESTRDFVGIIGSRHPSNEEWNTAYHLARHTVKKGKIVVSGLANGIDTAAHRGALDEGGTTIAILNTPMKQSRIYPPENVDLAAEIIKTGCLIHPYQTTDQEADHLLGKEKGMNRFTKRLIERNILLAHLCPAIVTVGEAEIITGGTKWAMNYGKLFDKKVIRCDSKGRFDENPQFEQAKVWWEMELTLPC